MDAGIYRCACRVAGYTVAMAAILGAPAALQAAIILRPDMLTPQHVAAAMSCALAGAVVVVPALLHALVSRDG